MMEFGLLMAVGKSRFDSLLDKILEILADNVQILLHTEQLSFKSIVAVKPVSVYGPPISSYLQCH